MAKTKPEAGQFREVTAMREALTAFDGLEKEEQARVFRWLGQKLSIEAGSAQASLAVVESPSSAVAMPLSPAAGSTSQVLRKFVAHKRPGSITERIACLAYFLTRFRETAVFKTKDITLLNTEAGMPKMSNSTFYVRDATSKAQYLASAGSGKKQLSLRGEAVVEALPDREAVGRALEANPPAGRTKRPKARKRGRAKK